MYILQKRRIGHVQETDMDIVCNRGIDYYDETFWGIKTKGRFSNEARCG